MLAAHKRTRAHTYFDVLINSFNNFLQQLRSNSLLFEVSHQGSVGRLLIRPGELLTEEELRSIEGGHGGQVFPMRYFLELCKAGIIIPVLERSEQLR